MLAVVTGATSGIGRSYAEAFAQLGCDLIITGRRVDGLKQVADHIRQSAGVSVALVTGDLTNPSTFEALLAAVGTNDLHFLVNNAGSGFSSNFDEAPRSHIASMNRLLATLPADTISALLPNLLQVSGATIINVGSLAGRLAVPGSSVYCASKIYLERLSETLALELAPRGLVVQALVPGYVRTDFHRDIPDYRQKQRSKGLIRWLDAERVVRLSLGRAELARKRFSHGRRPRPRDTIVTPGIANRVLAAMARFVPRRLLYAAAASRRKLE